MAVLERFSEREPDYWSYRAATQTAPGPVAARPQGSPPAPSRDEPALGVGRVRDRRWPSR